MDESPYQRDEEPLQQQPQAPLLPNKLDVPWQWVLLGIIVGALLMNMRPVIIKP